MRREETAAIRSQSNTAKLLQDNPTLMRLRELEVLEKIASTGKLNMAMPESPSVCTCHEVSSLPLNHEI